MVKLQNPQAEFRDYQKFKTSFRLDKNKVILFLENRRKIPVFRRIQIGGLVKHPFW